VPTPPGHGHQPAPAATRSRVFASPVVRKVAKEKGIDLARIAGTGPNGRIVRRDIERLAASRKMLAFTTGHRIEKLAPRQSRNQQPAWHVESSVKGLYLVAVVALTTATAACGTQTAGQPAQPPSTVTAAGIPAGTATASPQAVDTASARPPSPPATLTGPAMLTAADNGAIVRLHVGQLVTVALASEGLFSWHVPAATGPAVRRVRASGGYPAKQPAQAAFLAIQPGEAMLTSINDTACLHSQPACLPAQQEWRATVIVTGS
jgi:hypothetical protein